MARQYRRDSRGRFASTGTSRPKVTGGTLAARASLRGSRQRLETNATAAQRGAVTRATNRLAASRRENRRTLSAAPAARFRPGRRDVSTPAASGIRPTGGLQRTPAANSIRRTTGDRRAPMALKANAIRTYRPVTPSGDRAKGERSIRELIGKVKQETAKAKGVVRKASSLMRRMEMQRARAFGDRFDKGLKGRLAGDEINYGGRLNRAAGKVIQRRMERAAEAAARGSKPAARAQGIYAAQLAGMGPGKPKRGVKNNLRPGPQNNKGTSKRRRKRKG